ncbi:MAG: hypothetical protein M3552_00335 [Planctomycetota bacterium]|nr:hypothetical protein [Planctomycetaceae bacterium]MDQ3329092.1 hypothetical protein [Planctomycetota bacterium]
MTASHQPGEPIDERADERDWLAIRYVLGELAEDEAAEFECRLADDQPTREALARATTLVETVAIAHILPVVRPAERPRRRMFAGAALTAAALCVGLLGYFSYEPASNETAVRRASYSVDSARIAALWVDSAVSLSGIPEAEAAYESAADPQLTLLPPDWLLAAVEQEAALSRSGPAFDADAIERN